METIEDEEDDQLINKINIDLVEEVGCWTADGWKQVSEILPDYDPCISGANYKTRKKAKKAKEKPNSLNFVQQVIIPNIPPKTPDKTVKNLMPKKIKTLHWNANSVVGKVNDILSLILESNPDVVSLNETRTNSTTEAYIYDICKLGYYPIIRNRKKLLEGKIVGDETDRTGGGVALLIKDSILIKEEFELPTDKFTLIE